MIKNKFLTLTTYAIWFSELPFEVDEAPRVTFMSGPSKLDLPGFNVREHPTIVFDLNRSPDALWKGVGKTSRQRINRADREGV